MSTDNKNKYRNTSDADTGMQALLAIMTKLRDPNGGCPWDLKQNFATIVPHTLEEAYEVADAVDSGDRMQLRDELGDLLFQVVFYSQLAKEEGSFHFADVSNTMVDKLIRRHPHVFGGKDANNSDEALANWEAIKQTERDAKQQLSVLDDIPRAVPGLHRAEKIQQRAANVGFDWPQFDSVVDKLDEEVAEMKAAQAANDKAQMLDEIGDIMFVCVNLIRHLKANPETTMRAANDKFEQRFRLMESQLQFQGIPINNLSTEELEEHWQQVKQDMASDS